MLSSGSAPDTLRPRTLATPLPTSGTEHAASLTLTAPTIHLLLSSGPLRPHTSTPHHKAQVNQHVRVLWRLLFALDHFPLQTQTKQGEASEATQCQTHEPECRQIKPLCWGGASSK